MSDYYMGQVMMAAFGFAPRDFALCNGQLLPINQNQALFSLLGTQYGGNGTTNFQLPDLRGRTPVGYASSVDAGWQPAAVGIGQVGGTEMVTLLSSQIPPHSHVVNATTAAADNRNPANRLFATAGGTGTPLTEYAPAGGAPVAMNPASVAPAGGGQPHSNMQPYSAINFCIALQGIYPSRN